MRNDLVLDLANCTTFRQTLLARPPRITHGAVVLLVGLVGTALAWAGLAQADLVVRASGRVRPLDTPQRAFSAARGEVLSASTGGRVVEVFFQEGDRVQRGALLIRLATDHLDNDIAKQQRTIRAVEEELANLRHLEELTTGQLKAARAKADAEVTRAEEEVTQAEQSRTVDIRLAEVELESARAEEARGRRLAAANAAPLVDLEKAVTRLREAKQKLAKARLPVAVERIQVARQARQEVESEYTVKRKELELRRQVKEGELARAKLDLANRQLEREQAEIRAPIAGIVTRGDIKVGDVLPADKPVVEIARQTGFLFEVTVPSEDLGHLQVGMPARIKLDPYDYQYYGTLGGTVCFLAPDSGLDQGQSRATHIVRIALEGDQVGQGEFQGQVKLGMSGQVDIVTGQESLLALLVKRIRQTISLK
jgi:multidrug resistance efflux pump